MSKNKNNENLSSVNLKKIMKHITNFEIILAVFLGITSFKMETISREMDEQSVLMGAQYIEPLVEVEFITPYDNSWKDIIVDCTDYEGISEFNYFNKMIDYFEITYGTIYYVKPKVFMNSIGEYYAVELIYDEDFIKSFKGHTHGTTQNKEERNLIKQRGSLSIKYDENLMTKEQISQKNKYNDFFVELEEAMKNDGYTKSGFPSDYFIVQLFFNDVYGNQGVLNYIYQTTRGGAPASLIKISKQELSEYTKNIVNKKQMTIYHELSKEITNYKELLPKYKGSFLMDKYIRFNHYQQYALE